MKVNLARGEISMTINDTEQDVAFTDLDFIDNDYRIIIELLWRETAIQILNDEIKYIEHTPETNDNELELLK